MKQLCQQYAGDRKVLPVMELIAATIQPAPGPDGMWRTQIDHKIIDEWLAVARANGAILLLNIQPGQARFVDEAKALEKYLSQPDVGLALDPEWSMKPGQVPMQQFGSTTGAELDAVSEYLAGLVKKHNLPQKVMLYHILNVNILSDEAALQDRPEVAPIKAVDGIGAPAAKIHTYQQVTANTPSYVTPGFKLFYEEDVQTSGVLMTPEEVLAIDPNLGYVLYE